MNAANQILLVLGLTAFLFVNSSSAGGREASKKFELKKVQRLNGMLKDPAGDPVYGFQIDLLKGGKLVLSRTVGNDGIYDLGEVQPGKYKLRISKLGFCAPEVKCDDSGCKISPVLKLGPSTTVVM